MATDEQTQPVAQRLGWPVAVAVATTTVAILVTFVLDAAVKQHAFWAAAAIACLAVVVAWLTAATRAGAAARRRIDELERRVAAQRESLDRLEVLTARVTRAAFPAWLLVAIEHSERTGRRIDVVPDGLRFVSAAGHGEWTVELPVSADPAAQARDHEGLHRTLGIGQLEYIDALLEPAR